MPTLLPSVLDNMHHETQEGFAGYTNSHTGSIWLTNATDTTASCVALKCPLTNMRRQLYKNTDPFPISLQHVALLLPFDTHC